MMLNFVVYMRCQWFLCMFFGSIFNEEYPPITEEDALAKWAADPANTAWMESKREKCLSDLKNAIVNDTYLPVERKTVPLGQFLHTSFLAVLRKQIEQKLFF